MDNANANETNELSETNTRAIETGRKPKRSENQQGRKRFCSVCKILIPAGEPYFAYTKVEFRGNARKIKVKANYCPGCAP